MLEEKKTGGNNFIAQAGILAVAGIVCRIIGLLYRSPLSEVIGTLGLGYYSSAYTFYTIVLLISSYSIPSAISKVIAQKLALHEYKNAHRLFIGAILYVLVIGSVASLFLFFGAGLFVAQEVVPVLRMFAPTIFIYGLLGVLRGYFQAHKSMVQTSISQIFEQIANAGVSIGAAFLLIKLTMGTMEVPSDNAGQVLRAVRGAMGSATGTGCGVLVALIVMLVFYLKARPELMRRMHEDEHKSKDSAGNIIKTITMIVTPFILSTAIYNLSAPINTKIFTDLYIKFMSLGENGKSAFENLITAVFNGKSIDISEELSIALNKDWGIFSGMALTISNIPIAFASAMASAMIPSVAQLVAAKKNEEAKEKIGVAVKTTMLISIPCAVGLFILAGPVTLLLFPSAASNLTLATRSLMALAVSVVFFALSTLNSSILQGLGKVNTPIVNAAIALVVQSITAIVLLFFTPLGLYSIAIANTLYSAIMAVLNQRAVRNAVGYKQEIKRTFVLTFAASAVMGAFAYGVYRLVLFISGSMRIAVIPAIIAAVPVYFVAMILTKAVTSGELKALPKGRLLVKIAKKLRLMH